MLHREVGRCFVLSVSLDMGIFVHVSSKFVDWLQHLAKRMPGNIAAQMGINDDDDVYTPQQLTCMKLGGTLITLTGFCWRCHSTEHNTYKCPNAKDDKYDGNYEKNHNRWLELKEIEMKKEKKCSRCTAKKKLY